jgi:hypothetical protein
MHDYRLAAFWASPSSVFFFKPFLNFASLDCPKILNQVFAMF